MIDRLERLSTGRQILAYLGLAAGIILAMLAAYTGLKAADQNPFTWFGWGLTGCAIAAPTIAAVRLVVRHVAAQRTGAGAYVPAPDWLRRDWFDAGRAAGVTTVPPVAQYAGLGCMARTLGGVFEHEDLLLIHPALIDQPRPLVRYTLAVEAARLATHLSTASATTAFYAASVAEWSALVFAGLSLLSDPTSGALLLVAAVSVVAAGIANIVADGGSDVYFAADAIAHRYMGCRLTDDIIDAANAAETSGAWIYGRFEPDLDTRAEVVEHLPGPADELVAAPTAGITGGETQLRVLLGPDTDGPNPDDRHRDGGRDEGDR